MPTCRPSAASLITSAPNFALTQDAQARAAQSGVTLSPGADFITLGVHLWLSSNDDAVKTYKNNIGNQH